MDHSKETTDWVLWVVSVIGLGNIYTIIKLVVLVPKQIKDLETKVGKLEQDHEVLVRMDENVKNIKATIDRITKE